jgi:signal transduction histidine kinase
MSSTAKANAALAAAVTLLLLSSCAAYLAFARLQTSQDWVRHTRDVQRTLDHYSIMITRASRLRTEYVDSGDADFLPEQSKAVVEVRNTLSLIQHLTADNVNQQDECRTLQELTERRIGLMDQAIELKRSGKSSLESQASIGRKIVSAADETDSLLQRMDDEEQRLLVERQKREASSFSVIVVTLLTSLLFALVMFLVHHRLLTEQVRERFRAETAQRALSARLLTLQDEERRRFARELHDSVGQHLAAMKMGISLLAKKLPGDPMVQDCLKLLDDSITETRTISHLLHPPLLDEAGLNSAVQWFVEGFAARSGIEVNLKISNDNERFSQAVELVLFRALQEALTNVHRHSQATHADVSLATLGNYAILSVKDHGRGIPDAVLENLKKDGTGGGVGLAGMTERIREIGGQLEIHSGPNGTELVARVPIHRRVPKTEPVPAGAQEVNG